MATQRSKISDGPSKFDLMLALFDRGGHERRIVRFIVTRNPSIMKVVVTAIEWEGGMDSWIFGGYCAANNVRLSGYYNSQNRQGWIEEVSK